MSKKLIIAAIATVFALGTMQAPAFAKGGKHSSFNANGGNGGNRNKGNNSGNGGAGGSISF